MKLMIASDIHGSLYYCRQMKDRYEKEQAGKLILLGDILYHGPRNDLPRDYLPKEVIPELNEMKSELLCVRGNCDTEVDQMVLDFPILSDSMILYLQERMVFATHGHVFHENKLPPLQPGDILLHGHTHVPTAREIGPFLYLNPGSVSIPKEDSPHSYLVYENGVFIFKRLEDGSVYRAFPLEKYS